MNVSQNLVHRFSDVRAGAKAGLSRIAVPLAGLTLLTGAAMGFVITSQPAAATTTYTGAFSHLMAGSENPGTLSCSSASNCGTLWAGYNWNLSMAPVGGSDSVNVTSLNWSFPYTCSGSGSGTWTLSTADPGTVDVTSSSTVYPQPDSAMESSNESWEAVPITLTNGCTSGTPVFTENNGTFSGSFTATTDNTLHYQSHASYCPDTITVPEGSNPNQTRGCGSGSWGSAQDTPVPTAVAPPRRPRRPP